MSSENLNQAQPLDDPLLTPEQVAQALGVCQGTLQNWRVNGTYDLPYIKIGRRLVRYRRSAVEHFAASRVFGMPKSSTTNQGGSL